MLRNLTAAMCLVFASGVAGAQEMAGMDQNCTTVNTTLPRALSGWAKKGTLGAAADAAKLNAAALPLAQGVQVVLHPTREVHYITQPEKPGGSVAHGGMVSFSIKTAGNYQVSLSSGAWIDVLKDGVAQPSVAHAPGPKCSPIRKTVVFSLQPGSYVLQLSANAGPQMTLMVSRVS
jgi:hypothetical protein